MYYSYVDNNISVNGIQTGMTVGANYGHLPQMAVQIVSTSELRDTNSLKQIISQPQSLVLLKEIYKIIMQIRCSAIISNAILRRCTIKNQNNNTCTVEHFLCLMYSI